MRLLVPIDGSDPAWSAFEYALDRHGDDELIVVHVVNPVAGLYSGEGFSDYDQLINAGERRAEQLFETAHERAADSTGTLETETLIGNPTNKIIEAVDDYDIDQIIIGSHGRAGVSRILLGSVAEAVVRRSTVPVTVTR